MKASYYFKRIVNDKVKLFFMILLFMIPILDLILTFIDVPMGAYPEKADANTFLAATSHNSITRSLMMYFFPICLLFIAGEDCFEDASTGYRNVLISKWGKKGYVRTNIIKAFCISFSVLFVSLLLNLLMAHIIYSGSEYSQIEELLIYYEPKDLYYFEAHNPLLANVFYIFTTSVLSGLVGAAGAALAMAINKRKIVYPLLFLIWSLPQILNDKMDILYDSLELAFQPFTEYSLGTKVFIYLLASCVFIAVIFVAAIKEIRYAKI